MPIRRERQGKSCPQIRALCRSGLDFAEPGRREHADDKCSGIGRNAAGAAYERIGGGHQGRYDILAARAGRGAAIRRHRRRIAAARGKRAGGKPDA